MSRWYVGTMGYSYADWVGVFYPGHLKPKQYLASYSKIFNTVEMDTTFYGTPSPAKVRAWKTQGSKDFTFCPKTPKNITHEGDPAARIGEMQHFVDSVSHFGDQLGPILVQFPPEFDSGRLASFQAFGEALPGSARFAVEFRHPSWFSPEVFSFLKNHHIGWVSAEYHYLPKKLVQTADFIYIRFIGRHGQFDKKDRLQREVRPRLEFWLEQVRKLQDTVSEGYAFFNNDFSGHSPATANAFKTLLGLPVQEPQIPRQSSMFE